MSRSRKAIISDFLQSRSNTNYNSLESTGRQLYSYSTLIAYWTDASVVIRLLKYSQTTTRQINELISQCQSKGIAYKTSEALTKTYWTPTQITWSEPK